MKRILIANIFGIGDVLFTTPLITNLKTGIKGVEVDYLCNARTKELLELEADIDKIFVYEKDDLAKLWKSSKAGFIRAVYGLISSLRKRRYDAVFDFTLSREFGFLFKVINIPRRIGFNYKGRGVFLTHKLELKGFEKKHVIEHYLDLLGLIGLPAAHKEMQLAPAESDMEWAKAYVKESLPDGKYLVAVIPGGGASWGKTASRKRWDAEDFAITADILASSGVNIAVLGDASEEVLCGEVYGKMSRKPAIFTNSLSLKQYAALLGVCDMVLCNDGGPLHIAVALGVRTVSIFGPVDDKVYGPYPVTRGHKVFTAEDVSCRPCYGRFKLPECEMDSACLKGIDPARVADLCLRKLKEE